MKLIKWLHRFHEREDGPTAAEYAVMLALILLAVISAITAVGNSTSQMWQTDATKISNAVNSAS
jgi:pilus assembly protein Flp/PilA